jgi:glycerophosphoryl diester phosphodiesterase
VPLLEEVIELVRGRAGLVVELKRGSEPYPGYEELLLAALREAGIVDEVTVVSFEHEWIRRLKEMEPGLLGGLLEITPSDDPALLLARWRADFYAPHWTAATPELVASAHAAGGWVGVWTVDDRPSLEQSLAAGVDSLFSNRPGEIAAALAEAEARPPG